MGLDITAYRKAELIDTLPDTEAWEEKYYWPGNFTKTCFIYPPYVHDFHFAEWAKGLVAGGVYRYEEEFDFRAGSYSGYNVWRAQLCQMALGVGPGVLWENPLYYRNHPFYRLINFSDCEGLINAEFSAGLAKDFAAFQDHADHMQDDGYFAQKYADWREAFEMAADGGFVYFH